MTGPSEASPELVWDGPAGTWARRHRWRRLACGIALMVSIAGPAFAEDHGEEEEPSWLPEWLEIGGSIEVQYERRRDFDLDNRRDDDLDLLPTETVLEITFEPSDYFKIYVQPNLTRDFELREEGDKEDRNTEFSFEEAYATLQEPDTGLFLQFGRLFFGDDREWLYDEALDGARGGVRARDYFLELSWSREGLVDVDLLNPDEIEEVDNYLAYGGYRVVEDITIGGYAFLRDSRETPDDPLFLGVFSYGSVDGRLDYWLDAAHVRGDDEDGRDLRGFGVDILGSYHFDVPLQPHILLGYAFGSGDAGGGTNNAFRQTGLQSNGNDVTGMNDFLYYGEAFEPELSNMSIFTAGIGATPIEDFAIDLVYHHYRQDEKSDELRDSALNVEPTGGSRSLGDELDFVIGYEGIENLRLTGFLGFFMPGKAFGDGADNAFLARIELEYEF